MLTRPDDPDRPWANHPFYRGMSDQAAAPSWAAREKPRLEDEAVRTDRLPEPATSHRRQKVEYGLSADSVTEQILEFATALPTQRQLKLNRFPEIRLSPQRCWQTR